jgi:cobalt-zinc-cadmium efflux system outer membrane protein
MRKLVLPLGLAAIWLSPFLFLVPAHAQPALRLTLDQAQALAASRSVAISAAQRSVEAADGALRQAGVYRNPELNASVEDTRSAARSTTATLDFPVELGGKRSARVNAADRARELAQAELSNARAQLRADVMRAFFAVLVAQERVALAENSADLATRAADMVGKRVVAGKVSPVDETRARVDQANAQLEAAEAVTELQDARQWLAALWGDSQWQFGEVQGNMEMLPARATAAELIGELEASPGLLTSRIEVERRKALVEVERSKGVPDLTLSVGAKRDNELGRTQAIVGISIPLPLFDRNQGATYEAARRADKAVDEHQAVRIRLTTELQQASHQLALAKASAQSLKSAVLPAAQQAYDAASKGFEAGKFGFLDVIDAQRSLLQARARYLNALSRSNQAASTIDRLLGR